MQVHPIKPTLKPPGVNIEKLLSFFGFKFNLRRYITAALALCQSERAAAAELIAQAGRLLGAS